MSSLALVIALLSGQFFTQACKQGSDCTLRNLTVTGAISIDGGVGGTPIISASAENLSPSLAIDGSAVEMLSLTPSALTASRTVLLIASGTAYSTGLTTLFEFYVEVNGTPTARRRIFFNPIGVHMSFTGSWLVSIPSGAVTVKLYGIRMAGAGTVTLNSDDYVSFSYQG